MKEKIEMFLRYLNNKCNMLITEINLLINDTINILTENLIYEPLQESYHGHNNLNLHEDNNNIDDIDNEKFTNLLDFKLLEHDNT